MVDECVGPFVVRWLLEDIFKEPFNILKPTIG